eukprot:s3694_g6.t1
MFPLGGSSSLPRSSFVLGGEGRAVGGMLLMLACCWRHVSGKDAASPSPSRFDALFVQALLGARLSNVQVVLAMEVESPGTFAAKNMNGPPSWHRAHEVFASRPHMLEQFYIFAKGSARCEKVPRQRDARSIVQFQRDMAIRVLAAPVLAGVRPSLSGKGAASSSNTPLLDQENAEKQKWAKRLKGDL